MSNEKIDPKIKLSNNSSFAILIFVILKFRNISRSTFEHYKFCTPPLSLVRYMEFFLCGYIMKKKS